MTIDSKIYSVREAADLFGITEGRIRQLCRAFEIGRKIGRDWLLTEADIHRLESAPGTRFSKISEKSPNSD
jgi:hypothetical protein